MHNKVKQLVNSKDEGKLSSSLSCAGKHETMNEASNGGGDMMTTDKLWMKGDYVLSEPLMKGLAIVKHNMTEKEFMEHWATIYPQHCFGGYDEDQYTLWQANPFEFVAKWPVISHYIIRKYC